MNKGDGYPPKQLLDLLSRNSDVLVGISETLRALATGQVLSPQQLQGIGQLASPTPTPSEVPYDDVPSIKLDTATTDYEVPGVYGDFLDAWTDGDLSGITVRFNSLANKALNLGRRHTIYGFKFNKLYLSWTAQAGKVLDLFIGREASAFVDSPTLSDITGLTAVTPTKYAVTITSASTEYSQLLPTGTKKFRIHLRDFATFRFAYTTGLVAIPTDPYETVPANGEKFEDGLNLSGVTLYFASPVASKIAEVEAWV